MRWHKIKEATIKYIPANKMLVDPVTKPIPIDTFKTHMLSLGLHLVM